MESPAVLAFKSWFTEKGGELHSETRYGADASGSGILATGDLPAGQNIVSCPFDLVIDQGVAKNALGKLLGDGRLAGADALSARQWISTYIAFHWIVGPEDQSDKLAHAPYLATLPHPSQLRTPLHFTPKELEIFRGTNLYGATQDREREWRDEWSACKTVVSKANAAWGELYLWEHYLTAATYLSSRAFPSSLLSSTPSLQYDPSTEPVLIPGVDALNHARGQPVSWVVNQPSAVTSPTPISSSSLNSKPPTDLSIALVIHTSTKAGEELNNNYGPKPNAELILGYGFSLPHNLDDTMVLKLGGGAGGGRKFEVGRRSVGVEAVWEEILGQFRQGGDQDEGDEGEQFEDILDAALMFKDMLRVLQQRLPEDSVLDDAQDSVRPEVARMFQHYVEGQRDIVSSLYAWAREKERIAVQMAREAGEEIDMESDEEAGEQGESEDDS